MAGQVLVPRSGAFHVQAHGIGARPAVDLRVGDLRVELDADGRAAVAHDLVGKRAVGHSQQPATARNVEALAMPLVDVVGHLAESPRTVDPADRVIADLDIAMLTMIDPGAEILRQHLRAEADAEERLVLLQRDADPLDLAADERIAVVGALRAAEDDGAAVMLERLRQWIVETASAHIQRVTVALEPLADMARVGMALMQYDQD